MRDWEVDAGQLSNMLAHMLCFCAVAASCWRDYYCLRVTFFDQRCSKVECLDLFYGYAIGCTWVWM